MHALKLLVPMAIFLSLAFMPAAGQARQLGQAASTQRSASHAMTLGLASTLGPTTLGILAWDGDDNWVGPALLLTSWILGPAPGLFYSGNGKEAWNGIAFRAVSFGITVGGVAIMEANSNFFDHSDDTTAGAGALIALLGFGMTVGSWIGDLGKIRPSVERFNRSLEAAPLLTLGGRVGAQLTYCW